MKEKHFSNSREVFSQAVNKLSSTAYFVFKKIHNVSLAILDDEFVTVLKTEELIGKL
ncbi:hypothetical protein [Bacillus thuringiensis]|uniref:hypothetical protein n=1 Tax=Bacillus thuringiensis TaxID=1428 RepID=UPI00403D7C8F